MGVSSIKRQFSFRLNYPHTSLGPVYKGIEEYVNKYVYKFNTNIQGTFDKTLEQIMEVNIDPQAQSMGLQEPYFVYNPQIQGMANESDLPRNFWNEVPLFTNYFQKYMYFQDGTYLNFVPNRMVIQVPFKVFTESKLQVDDLYIAFNNVFRNKNKYLYLDDCIQWVLIPTEIILKKRDNGLLLYDFKKRGISKAFIPSINSDHYYLPLSTKPIIKMTSLNDDSDFYGGTGLPTYNLSGSFELEVEIPVALNIYFNMEIDNINIDVDTNDFQKNINENNNNSDQIPEQPDIDDKKYDDIIYGPGEGSIVVIPEPDRENWDKNDPFENVDIIKLFDCNYYEVTMGEIHNTIILEDNSFNLYNDRPWLVILDGKYQKSENFKIIDAHTLQILEWPDFNEDYTFIIKVCRYEIIGCHPKDLESRFL